MTELWKDSDDFINGVAQYHSASNVSSPPPLSNTSILIPNDESLCCKVRVINISQFTAHSCWIDYDGDLHYFQSIKSSN